MRKHTMKNMSGFIDPMSLGFLLSFIGTTTVLVTHDDEQIDTVNNTIVQVEMQETSLVETDDSYE